jgi:hypothetical protein
MFVLPEGGKTNDKFAAVSTTFAVSLDGATVQPYESANEGEAYTESAMRALQRLIALNKQLK